MSKDNLNNTAQKQSIPQTQPLAKYWQPSQRERDIYAQWRKAGYFSVDLEKSRTGTDPNYCILIPPPNVTGTLHMGHGFQLALSDALIRYHRMLGHHTLWQLGTDHSGISTQMVVERRLEAQGVYRRDLGREKFLEEVHKWKEQSQSTILGQIARMGASLDWSRERFTMDPAYSEAVILAFVKLYEKGLIRREKTMVNWDPKLQTVLSDLEVTTEEESGTMWEIDYPLCPTDSTAAESQATCITVATTRPETLLGDVAVAVHPNDERHQHLIGKKVILPITGRELPIIADSFVDPEFGTGFVKITPAHDFNDHEAGKRHGLTWPTIMDATGAIVQGSYADDLNIPTALQGLDRYEAREAILELLKAENLLRSAKHHKQAVPRGVNSNVVVEPRETYQWFTDTKEMAQKALDAVAQGAGKQGITFYPEQWVNTYTSWLKDIRDWCISRQLWWGHQLPVWYRENDRDRFYVAANAEEAKNKAVQDGYNGPLVRDSDVLDTWFSSGLWSFVTLGWPQRWRNQSAGEELKTSATEVKDASHFHPTSVMITAFDIIFFWIARMVMMTDSLVDELPFEKVLITGLIRDSKGQKMSKSKGNVLDPVDLIDGIGLDELVEKRTFGLVIPAMKAEIEKSTKAEFPNGIEAYGTDAVRMTYCSLASGSRNISFDTGRVGGYRNFCNKMWNAVKFVLDRTSEGAVTLPNWDSAESWEALKPQLSLTDKWILDRLCSASNRATQGMQKLRLDLAQTAFYEFFWNEFCDWYLECVKADLYDPQIAEDKKSLKRGILLRVLETALRLGHPFAPYITEELWQKVVPLSHPGGQRSVQNGQAADAVMITSYPGFDTETTRGQFSVSDGPDLSDKAAHTQFSWVMDFVNYLRNHKSTLNIPSSSLTPIAINKCDAADKEILLANVREIEKLARVKVQWASDSDASDSAQLPLNHRSIQAHLHFDNSAAIAQQIATREKECTRLTEMIQRLEAQLANTKFTANAPEQVVAEKRAQLRRNKDDLAAKQRDLHALTGTSQKN